MRKSVISFLTVALLAVLWAVPVYAQEPPALPHAFYGSVLVNGDLAPVGTTVEATGEGVVTGIAGNPITVTIAGQYGGPVWDEEKLVVQGDIADGATLTFYVNGESTGQTAEWHSGETTELDLSVTIEAPPPPTGGGGAPPAVTTVTTTLFGASLSFSISDTGEIQETITATSVDGNLTITIPADTIALDKDRNPLSSLTANVDATPPPPPAEANIIGLAYEFGPDGVTFDPPITLTWSYDPDEIPEGVAEEDLVIAYYDEADDEWVELDCVVDTENDTITASVSHFTTFAIIGAVTPPSPAPAVFSVSSLSVKPLEVEPNEAVTISLSVANTGGTEGSYTVVLKINGVEEAEKNLTIAAGSSEIVTFSVTREETGSYNVAVNGLSGSFTIVAPTPPPEEEEIAPPEEEVVPPALVSPFNWPLIGGIIAAVVVVGLLIFFLVRRRGA